MTIFKNKKMKMLTAGIMLTLAMGLMVGCGGEKKEAAKKDKDAVYFLDEPENSLSIQFQIELANYISATARATRSQFIIATHSPVVLSMENARIYDLDSYPVSVCDWTELPNVRKYFDFFMEHKDEFEREPTETSSRDPHEDQLDRIWSDLRSSKDF